MKPTPVKPICLKSSLAAVLAVAAIALPHASVAQTYPTKTVTIVVPFGAGGTTDMLARILADRLSQRLKGTFIVENKAGAGGNIGVASVAKSTPDGYTIGMGTVSTHSINPNVYKSMPYDHQKDFAPLSLVASVPNLLLINPEIKANTVPELVEILKKEPGKHAFASSGAGTSIHLAGELFKLASGTDIIHVPYRSSGQVTQDLLGGKIMMTFDNITVAWPHVQAGKLKALATATPERLPFAKDIPAMSEFYPGFAATSWHGIFAPAGTPKAIVDQLSNEVQAIMREPETVEKLKQVGVTAIGSTQEEFVKHIASETARWKDVAAKAKIEIQ